MVCSVCVCVHAHARAPMNKKLYWLLKVVNGFVCNAACPTKDGGTGLGSSGSLVKLPTVTHQQMSSFTAHDAD